MQQPKISADLSARFYQVLTEIMEESTLKIEAGQMTLHELTFEISAQISRATEAVVGRKLAQSQDAVKQTLRGEGVQ